MDFAWNEEQQALRRSLIQFAENELGSDLIEEDRKQEFSWDGWKQCARMGIQGLPVAEEYGGGGAGILTTVCAIEALGYGCRNNGLLASLNSHLGAEMALCDFGSEAQKQRYLPRLASGEWVGAKAVVERSPESVSKAVRQDGPAGERWILNGSKTLVTNAPVAQVVIVFAKVEASDGPAAFIVERDMPGFTVSRSLERMGLRTSPLGDLALVDCDLPGCSLLGEVGSARGIQDASEQWTRILALAASLGMMQRQLETSARYAAERRQFGKPIGRFPAVAGKVAEMDIRLEASRLLLYRAAWLKNQGGDIKRELAIAKAYVSDAAIQTCRDAVQIHGGYGYTTEYQIERELRDAVSGKICSGSTDAQKTIIAGLHGLSD